MKSKVIVDACCHIPNAHIRGRVGRGQSSCGILIIEESGVEHEFSKFLGEMTAPEAEFHGLILALEKSAEITRWEIEIWMDSELVVKWMTGEYRLRKEHIQPLFDKAKVLESRYRKVTYFHHPETSSLGQRVHQLAEAEYRKNIQ